MSLRGLKPRCWQDWFLLKSIVENPLACSFQFLELSASLALLRSWTLSSFSKPVAWHLQISLCFYHHTSFSPSGLLLLSYTDPCDYIALTCLIQIFPHFKIISIKPLFSSKVIYSQLLEIKTWTSWCDHYSAYPYTDKNHSIGWVKCWKRKRGGNFWGNAWSWLEVMGCGMQVKCCYWIEINIVHL